MGYLQALYACLSSLLTAADNGVQLTYSHSDHWPGVNFVAAAKPFLVNGESTWLSRLSRGPRPVTMACVAP